jgi:hypothetical protein
MAPINRALSERRRRVREDDEARNHHVNAITAALTQGDHERAKILHKALEEYDEADEEAGREEKLNAGVEESRRATCASRWARRLLEGK